MSIIRYIILILYGTVLLKPVLPVADYLLRYDVYAQELCVMKDMPDNDCCGRCQVIDAIAKQQEQSPRTNSTSPSTCTSQIEETFHEIITVYDKVVTVNSSYTVRFITIADHCGMIMRGYIRMWFTPPDKAL